MIRNGRAVIDGQVRDIMLPQQKTYAFEFSRYKNIIIRPWPGEEGVGKVFCKNAETQRDACYEPEEREADLFWQRTIGFESGNSSNEATNEYRLIPKKFDILRGVDLVYDHPDLEDILQQLGISSLTPFFEPSLFGMESTGEKVQMEVAQMRQATGRTATFETPVIINGQPYFLEVKGVNFAEKPIELRKYYDDYAKECGGSLLVDRMKNSIDKLHTLNAHGYDSVLLIAAYELPLTQFDGQQLGVYIRAVKSSLPISHYDKNLGGVAEALGMSKEGLAEYIIRCAARDMAILWKLGITHDFVHEQNIRIGGVSDLTGAHYVRESGFCGVVEDVELLVATSQKIMRKLVGPGIEDITYEFYQTHPEEAERLMSIAEEKEYEGQARDYYRTREIITSELNKQLGLDLPPVIGTTTLAAEIYSMQKGLGLTDPDEEIHIEHHKGFVDGKPIWTPLRLDDLRVRKG